MEDIIEYMENQINLKRINKIKIINLPKMPYLENVLTKVDRVDIFLDKNRFNFLLKRKNITTFKKHDDILTRKEIYEIMYNLSGKQIDFGYLYSYQGKGQKENIPSFSDDLHVVKIRRIKKITDFTENKDLKCELKYVENESVILAIYIPNKYIKEV